MKAWIDALRAAGSRPCFFGERPLTADALLAQAASLAAELPEATADSETSFAFGHDHDACAVALVATWMRGHVAALPCDDARDNVMPVLSRAANAAFLHDTGVGRGIFVPPRLREAPPETTGPASAAGHLALFDPSTGEPASCLSGDELDALLRPLADRLAFAPGARVASTLSPSHWPGLLFGMLVPLGQGAQAASRRVPIDSVAAFLRAQPLDALVVTAAHARALARREPGALANLERLIVCAHDLEDGARARLTDDHDLEVLLLDPRDPPAWRERTRELEAALWSVPGVTDLCVRPRPGTADELLVAVEAPEFAHAALTRTLEDHRADPVRLRLLPSFPRNGDGAFPEALFHLAFGLGRDAADVDRVLDWSEVERDEDSSRLRARVPLRYAAFEGHFPPYPVLAGATQLDELVLPHLRTRFEERGRLRRASALKFLARIEPGNTIELLLRRGKKDHEYAFELLRDGARCTVGRLAFAPAEELG